jgi:serine/threonine protein kinase
MLVTDPKQRASLAEILNHPWLNKGFGSPPENHLPPREPVQLPLDQEVVRKMTGFEFGPPEFITNQITQVVESEEYQSAVRASFKEQMTPNPANEKKRGVFDFYKRRSSTSKDTLSSPSFETMHPVSDPIQGYNPLLSVYQLVKEKLDRERQEEHPGALSLHQPPGEIGTKVIARPRTNIREKMTPEEGRGPELEPTVRMNLRRESRICAWIRRISPCHPLL